MVDKNLPFAGIELSTFHSETIHSIHYFKLTLNMKLVNYTFHSAT